MSLLRYRNSGSLELNFHAVYLGLAGISFQVIFARLAVSFAGGNEVYLSLFFLFWLIFTATGALVIKKVRVTTLFVLFGILAAILPSLFYITPRLFNILPGQIITPGLYIIVLVIILLPICLINGGLFSTIARQVESEGRSAKAYYSEAFGALLAGVLTTVYYYLGGGDYSLILGLAIFCSVFVPLKKRVCKIGVLILFHIIIIFNLGGWLEQALLRIHYQPFDYQGSASGRLVRYDMVKTEDMATLYSGGVKLADFPPEKSAGELFYWPYLVKPSLRRIAFIGGEYQAIDKLIPDNIEAVFIYPENNWHKLIDSLYVTAEKRIIAQDPIAYFRKSAQKYDAIVVNRGTLVSLTDKRFETDYFIRLCYDNLTQDGILCFNVESYHGNWKKELATRLNFIYNRLNYYFDDIKIIPGDKLFLVAGDGFNFDQAELIARCDSLGIISPLFNRGYIKSRLSQFNIANTLSQLHEIVPSPQPYDIGYGLVYYFSQTGIDSVLSYINISNVLYIIIVAVVVLTIALYRADIVKTIKSINILFFGLVSLTIELVAIYKIQLGGGYLYMILGITIGLFMVGMSSGSFLGLRLMKIDNMPKALIRWLDIALTILVLLSVTISIIEDNQALMLLIIGLAGFGGGLGYAVGSFKSDDNPGIPYTIDLLGGVTGTVVALGILMGGLHLSYVFVGIAIFGIILLATNALLLKY